MSLKESKYVSQSLKNSLYTLENEVKVLNYLNEHFDITNPEELKSLSIIFTAYIAWKHLWHIEHAIGMPMGR